MLNLEKPVIAAVDGTAYGDGFGLALGTNFILLSEHARLCSVFSRISLIPDVSGIFTLRRRVGLQRAIEIYPLKRFIKTRINWPSGWHYRQQRRNG